MIGVFAGSQEADDLISNARFRFAALRDIAETQTKANVTNAPSSTRHAASDTQLLF